MDKVKPNGRRVAELRKQAGHVQKRFAKQVGLGESTLRKVETRDYEISRKRLEEIANKLGIELSELLAKPDAVPAKPVSKYEMELRPVTSSGLLDLVRFSVVLQHEIHIDVTKPMVTPIKTILTIAHLFRRSDTPGFERLEQFNPDWAEYGDLHAAAELTEALKDLKEMNVVVLANSKYIRDDSPQPRVEKWAFISFEEQGVTSRIVEMVPF